LVTAVLRPKRAEYAELRVGRFATDHFDDAVVFIGRKAVLLYQLRRYRWVTSAWFHLRLTNCCLAETSDSNRPRPSSEPSSISTARSGCGISPMTLPASLMMPAMLCIAPFGLDSS